MSKFSGLNQQTVKDISSYKKEPEWMRKFRLQALEHFEKKLMPTFGGDLTGLDLNKIHYFVKSTDGIKHTWEDVPEEIKRTYDKLGIPKLEQKFLAGVKAQWDSEMVYGSLLKDLEEQGVVFLSMDEGLQKYPDLVKQYFGTIIPIDNNKFASLNSAVWSGGSFIYVPPKVSISLPLQAYFRINAKNIGQFERTLIIADEGSFIHYIEGCSSPVYTTDSLHAGVVEIIVKKGARVRYTTVQNWSKNVYNLVTKRAWVGEDAIMEWVDFNSGSKLTMKYPSAILAGKGAKVNMLALAIAGAGQRQDCGGKAIHLASDTSSTITSKSISHHGGATSYRGLVKIGSGVSRIRSKTVCQALILDNESKSETYPAISAIGPNCEISHEATVSKISEEQIFYLQSRGITEAGAQALIVNGFIKPLVKELPFEYAIELNQLIRLEMEGGI
ncbi:Fe-S cluster assembly protein SufB [Candidatus Daviesbacteria bacterium RIFCSPLOWO2_02_FULL_41_8]|uniref:Fe-S cluster assembly protein SufB n=2 Tax=Candidatus Daviesiibacteriota TaxID=1752718 RepID=A0A1F5NIR5_9BACT|nr:MAG: Fe-S cluster assembly protein SufB [Candidatus Daviesbacteria bacterium RIFCSPHIGHO2_01_FULL_41_23]OGE77586.1 MAG: Fe-S cluster assembly protein SufB [Candidatus Daviesbacteria bacterium RIFCSPLOWO2_02_FULL_41_8]